MKSHAITVLACSCLLAHATLVGAVVLYGLQLQGAEQPAPAAPDPIPTAVRSAAAHMAKDGRLEVFTVTGVAPDLRYQVKLVDVATDQPVMATFAGDGALLSVLSIVDGAKAGPAPTEALAAPPRSARPDGREGPPAIPPAAVPPADKPAPLLPPVPGH